MTTTDQLPARFWRKVTVQGGHCWIWTGAKDPKGYGTFWWEERVHKAHRVAYSVLKAPIPDGLVIDHLCRNRACVNPDHMEPVTNRANILRGEGYMAQQARKTHCKRGHSFDSGNTYVIPSTGSRQCRTCERARNRRR